MSKDVFRVALLGYGTVGSGTYKGLVYNSKLIQGRLGAKIEVAKILVRNPEKYHNVEAPYELFTDDIHAILEDPTIDIVAEMLNGEEPAFSYLLSALNHGKSVVTANKAAIAPNLPALETAARKNNVLLRYEASVCAGMPVMTTISEALAGNEISKIEGILNGTCNYILTQMEENGVDFDTALKDAQAQGLAEEDSSADISGIDAANKLTILIAQAFGDFLPPSSFDVEGIESVTMEQMEEAKANKSRIKLIACAEKKNGRLTAYVRPEAVPYENPLAFVKKEYNGLLFNCNLAGDVFIQAKGAGSKPTGSAMVGDIIEVCLNM